MITSTGYEAAIHAAATLSDAIPLLRGSGRRDDSRQTLEPVERLIDNNLSRCPYRRSGSCSSQFGFTGTKPSHRAGLLPFLHQFLFLSTSASTSTSHPE